MRMWIEQEVHQVPDYGSSRINGAQHSIQNVDQVVHSSVDMGQAW